MKLKLLLALSLGLNLFAAGWFALAPSASRTVAVPAASTSPSSPSAMPSLKNTGAPVPEWTQALREAGVSEQRVGEIAAADFEGRWQRRMLDAQRRYNRGEMTDDALASLQLQHDAEEEKELRAKLGDDGFARWDRQNLLQAFDREHLNLSPTEADTLYALARDLRQAQHYAEQARLEGQMDEGDADRKAGAEQARYQEQLKTLLGDERYARMQNDNNPSAGETRRRLLDLNASADQVTATLQAQQEWTAQSAKLEEQLRLGQLAGPEYDRQIEALQTARDAAIQKALGAENYREFQNEQDDRYRKLKRYGNTWGLGENDVKNLYQTIQTYEHDMKDYQERARAAEAQGLAVDWPAVQASLAEYSKQTEAALQKSLGPGVVNKLAQHSVIEFDP